jgi:hypothetical protein
MKGSEKYIELTEKCIQNAEADSRVRDYFIAKAQVYATLAVAAVTWEARS